MALNTAKPGMFWDAIVTTKSGSAMPMTASRVKAGITRTGVGQASAKVPAGSGVDTPIATAAATTAAGTA